MATFVLVAGVVAAAASAGTAIAQGIEEQKSAEAEAKEVENAGKNEELVRLQKLNRAIAAQQVGVAVSGVTQTSGSVAQVQERQFRSADIAQSESDIQRRQRIANLKHRGRAAMIGGIVGGAATLSQAGSSTFNILKPS